jgi:hypothetical protein
MKPKLISLITILLISCATESFAQELLPIFGTLKTEDNQPIVDATMIFKAGTNTSSSTGRGRFIAMLKFEMDTLIITHPGYRPLITKINSRMKFPLALVMVASVSKLNRPVYNIFGSVDSAGTLPVMGASVAFKHGKTRSSTDKNGYFIASFRNNADTLIITHAGFKALIKVITPKTEYPLKLTLIPSIDQR